MSQLNNVPVTEEAARAIAKRQRSGHHAVLSAFVPGLGQFVQGRRVRGMVHFLTVVTYVVAAFGMGGRTAMFAAVAWNIWSAIDASRYEAD